MSLPRDVPLATRLGTLGVLVALSAAACEAVDHTMGAGTEGDLLSAAGADNADESDSAEDADINGLGGVNTTGSVNTTGGFNGVNGGVNTTGSVNTTGGGGANGVNGSVNNSAGIVAAASVSSSTTGAPGALAIPDSCTQLDSIQEDVQCQLSAVCDATFVSSQCFVVDGLFQCNCSNVLQGIDFYAYGMTLADACSQTLGACLNWPDVASGLSCVAGSEVNEPDSCVHYDECDLDIDGDSDLIATYFVWSDCRWNGQNWVCDCGVVGGPATGPSFTLATASSDPPCLDARGWCGGIGVEPTGNRTCTWAYQPEAGEFSCVGDVECERTVTLSGQEAMMSEWEVVECSLSDNGLQYSCSCSPWGVVTAVAAEDPASACAAAASLCETEG